MLDTNQTLTDTRGTSLHDMRRAAYAGLLDKHGIDETHLFAALNSALGQSGNFADIYLKESIAESWSLEGGAVRGGAWLCDSGFGMRVLNGEEATFASSQRIGADALRTIARQIRSGPDELSHATPRGEPAGLVAARSIYVPRAPLGAIGAERKLALLKRVDELARSKDPRVVEVNAMLAATHETVWVARCDGLSVGDVRPMLRLAINVRVKSGDRIESASGGIGGRYGIASWSDDDIRTLVCDRVDAALTKLDARAAPAGKMTVVVGPGWNGVLLHEAVGHGLEADGIRRKTSVFAGRVGERVAARNVTIVDDGTLEGRRGSLNFDDEGCPTQRTVLIEDGVLRGCMQDSLNARLMNMKPTGNGRRESYAVLPMPRMTNTFMLNGDCEHEEIIASVKRGIYVAGLEGGQVDITSGQFVFEASEAFLIENGRLCAPVKGATITGNGLETIQKISMVGNNLELDTGRAVCGKAGQSVPVSVGQPTVRVDDMTVGGTA
ncbi:metalloprotease TldD [Burkholderia contaminans]|uniref:metalloprotease TldD n=1 Tax=Burkholderia contaminans TaxID=488447 RepID=UPI0009E1A973|nr:metalloprotease TldD [Burkholderia contaminans]MEB4636460.1 metalloprotease TldD [Burkholderia contaminans]MEB4652000.1 metalloprotease TldD [Burkholderia contaminans]MEB4661569.1 metalloprotease TldD [Burkholderia contaminans]MEB4666819.1 metalloprotease TldD [Burkholderia contaminans]MEB4678801.1 metalloprotease TldD [Burkholderia contaminans]